MSEMCSQCDEAGRKTTATRKVGDEHLCEACFLGDDSMSAFMEKTTQKADRFCKPCGNRLGQFSKSDHCSTLCKRNFDKANKSQPVLRAKHVVQQVSAVAPVLPAAVIPARREVVPDPPRPSCKCGCGKELPKNNRTGYIWKHWPAGTLPWSTKAKNPGAPIEVPAHRSARVKVQPIVSVDAVEIGGVSVPLAQVECALPPEPQIFENTSPVPPPDPRSVDPYLSAMLSAKSELEEHDRENARRAVRRLHLVNAIKALGAMFAPGGELHDRGVS